MTRLSSTLHAFLLTALTLIGTAAAHADTTFPIVFDFSSASDAGGTFTAQLNNGAQLSTFGNTPILDLGTANGYADLGTDFGAAVHAISGDYSISVTLFIPSTTALTANGNFVWCLARSSSRGYLFLSAKDSRFAITTSSWNDEFSVGTNRAMARGRWLTATYVRSGQSGTLYIDGEAVATRQGADLAPADLNDLRQNYLGRSCYSGDVYLVGARYADFRVYDSAIDATELQALARKAYDLNHLPSDIAIAMDEAALTLPSSINNLYSAVELPTQGTYGSTIAWQSSDPSLLSAEGRVVGTPAATRTHVTLTATLTNGSLTATKTFDVYVRRKDSPYSRYLFTFFPSNSNENIYYALSADGYNYQTVNGAKAVVLAKDRTVMGGLRDPHILRGEDGTFYMVATDMQCSRGWDSNRGMVLMRSADLVHWTSSKVHFPTRYSGTMFANVTRVWAPETIWDAEAGKYLIYFSILTNDGSVPYDKVFYAYANADFTDLEGEPTYFYDRGSATIDMNIVYNENDGLYHAFYKNEGSGGICKVTASHLTAPAGAEGTQWSKPSGTLQQTTEAVEGAGVFRLIDSDEWILMYDCYTNGHYQFCSSPDLDNFTFRTNTATSGTFTPRHGTVIPITAEEYERLRAMNITDGITAIAPDGTPHGGTATYAPQPGGTCHDLSGRQVTPSAPGIYIIGGRKHVVR
jgi:hypothetical protein